jgi:hypothetical protein
MRGNVLAALVAAAIVALLSVWRITDRPGTNFVEVEELPGSWLRIAAETCNPPLPEKITITADGRYEYEDGAGFLRQDEDGRYALDPENSEYPSRVFRANSERLELLNQLGCKTTYARAE